MASTVRAAGVSVSEVRYALRVAIGIGLALALAFVMLMVAGPASAESIPQNPLIEDILKLNDMLLGVLMDDYLGFIDQLSQEANIMDKSFFIVVPYYPAGDMSSAVNTSKNLFTGLFKPEQQTNVKIDQATYLKAKDEIGNRVNAVVNGLFQMGVRSTQLGTKELASLYYNVYNPDTAVRQPLVDFEAITGTYVEKGQGMAPQPHLDRSQE